VTSTTKGAARQGDAPLTTGPGKASQQFRNPATGRNTTIMTHHFEPVDGQYVSCMHRTWTTRRTGVVVAVVPPASAAGHDYVAFIIEYPPSVDEHPAVQALAIYNGRHRGLFRADELQPVSADDTPPATDTDVVEHLTGTVPTVDEYRCPVDGCDFHILAAGPVEFDEPDHFAEEVEAHRRSHKPKPLARDEYGDVPAIPLWLAVRDDAPELFNLLATLARTVSPSDVARTLRAAAEILERAK
jgi:hypothetical protein